MGTVGAVPPAALAPPVTLNPFPLEEARLAFASLYKMLPMVTLFTERECIKGVPRLISNAFVGRGSGPGGG